MENPDEDTMENLSGAKSGVDSISHGSRHGSQGSERSKRSHVSHMTNLSTSQHSQILVVEKERELAVARQRLHIENQARAETSQLDEQLMQAQRNREDLALRQRELEIQRRRQMEEEELALERARLQAEHQEQSILRRKMELSRQLELERQIAEAEISLTQARTISAIVNETETDKNTKIIDESVANNKHLHAGRSSYQIE